MRECGVVQLGFFEFRPVAGAQGRADDDHGLTVDSLGAALVLDVGEGAANDSFLTRPACLAHGQLVNFLWKKP
uniref:Uncharacterized protein n=1 Tax=Candidatus Kentrum sp. UNK TaxID=2126344 RepID=A0A451AXG3_9GAMM|nr:MAG: hypothetical protein BECKUNK1418G_GA0071005_103913 [Candidatus Kentron sp. UNK]VFK70740.1 MAG: hypothetical protein BECKUNK1418H_GA0071006_103713 [Candidatus Kentron sp. UNK]